MAPRYTDGADLDPRWCRPDAKHPQIPSSIRIRGGDFTELAIDAMSRDMDERNQARMQLGVLDDIYQVYTGGLDFASATKSCRFCNVADPPRKCRTKLIDGQTPSSCVTCTLLGEDCDAHFPTFVSPTWMED